jgi:thiamine kinase-like enzyme
VNSPKVNRRRVVDEQIAQALQRIPVFSGTRMEDASAERLAGLTNKNYRVDANGASFVLRIPGEGTAEYIDREVEEHNARAAAEAEVNAEVLFFDSSDGLMLTRYLEGNETMSPEAFVSKPGAPTRAAQVLKRMHSSGKHFRFRFELFGMIEEYLGYLDQRDAQLPEGYHDVVKEAEAVREALDAHPASLAPCHNDPLTENFLDNGERMWLLDWEYSGMNDPFWDIGDVSVEAGLSDEQDMEMLEAYCDGSVSSADVGRMKIYKGMADLLWTLWGLIQHVNENPADDFWAYSTQRFERCKALMGTEDFGHYLRAVRTAE